MTPNSNKHTNSQNPQGLTKSSLRGTKQSRFIRMDSRLHGNDTQSAFTPTPNLSLLPSVSYTPTTKSSYSKDTSLHSSLFIRNKNTTIKLVSGFTLIELLVVIAIIGILSSILLTTFSGIRDKARIAAGQRFDSNLVHTISDQLVGEWLFDDPLRNGKTPDTSGNGNDGTINGAATTTGYNNKGAYSFDGSTDFISTNFSYHFTPTQPYTISAWFNSNDSSTDNGTNRRITCVIGAPTTGRPSLDVGSNLLRFLTNNGTTDFSIVTPINTGVWYFAVGVYDGTNMHLYLDGKLIQKTAFTQVDFSSTNLMIGAFNGSGGRFNSLIDGVRIYSSALSSSEIQKIYAEGVSTHNMAVK